MPEIARLRLARAVGAVALAVGAIAWDYGGARAADVPDLDILARCAPLAAEFAGDNESAFEVLFGRCAYRELSAERQLRAMPDLPREDAAACAEIVMAAPSYDRFLRCLRGDRGHTCDDGTPLPCR